MFRSLALAVAVVVATFCSVTMAADKPAKSTREFGEFVKVDSGKLTFLKGNEKIETTLDLDLSVKVTISGKIAKIEDLKKGMQIRLTVDANNKVTTIESGQPRRLG